MLRYTPLLNFTKIAVRLALWTTMKFMSPDFNVLGTNTVSIHVIKHSVLDYCNQCFWNGMFFLFVFLFKYMQIMCMYLTAWSTWELFIAPALPELLWLPTVWRCPYIEIAFSTLDCSIVPTCGAWCSATAAKRGPLKQSWAEIQHSRDDEPLGVLMQMRNVRVNGFFFFSSLGVLPGVLVDTLSLCSGDFCVECVLIVLHKFYIEL